MKLLFITITILLYFIGICKGQDKLELFPKSVEIEEYSDCYCEIDTIKLKEIVFENDFFGYKASYDYSRFTKIDLNNDGKCEIVHYFSSSMRGWPHDFLTIYRNFNDSIEKIGDFTGFLFSFAESDGNYLRINSGYIGGHKTNPIYYNAVYGFKDDKYVLLYSPAKTKGEFRDAGSKAYKEMKYDIAYINFCNALRTGHHFSEQSLHDANNVAITLIKMGKFEEVETILSPYLTMKGNVRELASAYYNLGLAEEKLGNLDKALKHFKKSCSLRETNACIEKIEKYTR